MDVGGAPPPLGAESFGQHLDHGVELLARQVAVGPGRAHQVEQAVLVPLVARCRRDDLLRQDVEWLLGDDEAVEAPGPYRAQQRRAFDEIVPRQREDAALGNRLEAMPRAAYPL